MKKNQQKINRKSKYLENEIKLLKTKSKYLENEIKTFRLYLNRKQDKDQI